MNANTLSFHTIKGALVNEEQTLHFPLTLIYGSPGSGKSRSIKNILDENMNAVDSDFHIIDPLSQYAPFHGYSNVFVFETACAASEVL